MAKACRCCWLRWCWARKITSHFTTNLHGHFDTLLMLAFDNNLRAMISTRCTLFLWIWFPTSFPITHNCCGSHNTHYCFCYLPSFLHRSIFLAPLWFLLVYLFFSLSYDLLFFPLATCLHPVVCITTAVNTNLWWNGCTALIFNYVSLY